MKLKSQINFWQNHINHSANLFLLCVLSSGGEPNKVCKLNIVNLNKQSKLFSQGMHPVIRVSETGKWERTKYSPVYSVSWLHLFNCIVYPLCASPRAPLSAPKKKIKTTMPRMLLTIFTFVIDIESFNIRIHFKYRPPRRVCVCALNIPICIIFCIWFLNSLSCCRWMIMNLYSAFYTSHKRM